MPYAVIKRNGKFESIYYSRQAPKDHRAAGTDSKCTAIAKFLNSKKNKGNKQ